MSLEYQNIELGEVTRFMEHWEQTHQRSSDYSFPILWGWAEDYGYQAATHENDGLYWIRQTRPDTFNLAPIGLWHRDNWGELLEKHFGKTCEFRLVPEKLLEIWRAQLGDRVRACECRGTWEYIYDIHALASLAGNKYMKKRNRVNQFRRSYDYIYRPLTPALIPAVAEFQEAWCQANLCNHTQGLRQENHGIQRILKHWCEIPNLRGGVIEISGKVEAYTIGELAGDMILVHFEKASLEYGAAYQAINKEFLAHMLEENPNLIHANREEDMNDPGLREAKMSYLPVGFIKKYRVKINL